MPIVAGVNISDNQFVEFALTSFYGIGRYRAKQITTDSGIQLNSTRVKDLTESQLTSIRQKVDATNLTIEGDLRREVQLNVRRLGDIKSYRGNRHRIGLPVRGQRTKTNARTKRGRRQAIANKKIAPKH